MDQLGRLRAAVEGWFGQLSPRERAMVSAAGAAVVIFVIWLSGHALQVGIRAREARIEQKTRVMAQVGTLASTYRRVQAERAAIEARLKGPAVQLMSHVAQTGTTLGVEVNDLRPTGAPVELDGGVTEESVEVNLPRIELERLARLVQGLERGPAVVKVRRLKLSTRTDDPKLVDATLVVSTYALKG
jgi:general secretion pathway protein M